MKTGRVQRITKYCPITGSSLTTIYRQTCFGWVVVRRYRMELTQMRTLGFRESRLPSVAKEYGDLIGYCYIYKPE